MSEQLIKLYFTAEQHPDIVDALMQVENLSGFTLYAVEGFSHRQQRFDLNEQIKGSRSMYSAEVICNAETFAAIKESLSNLHFNEPLRYYITELHEQGCIEAS
ncbi:MAG: DUF3240 family protein [Pseudomonadota bacterium]